MVKVEIVEEKDQDGGNSPYSSHASSRTSSSVSLSSVGSDLDAEETFYERLTALVDIVPPTTRHKISTRFAKTTNFLKTSGKVVGNIVWIVTTSALLVGLPLALSLEDEAKIVAQEKEQYAQQYGAQQVRALHVFSFTRIILRSYVSPSLHTSNRPITSCYQTALLILLRYTLDGRTLIHVPIGLQPQSDPTEGNRPSWFLTNHPRPPTRRLTHTRADVFCTHVSYSKLHSLLANVPILSVGFSAA